ncbi:MAG TPA: molybdopterin-guanine dinucleotide biosynthesis protein B [Methanoculleus sp.]|nr:molybdopterin-guanine dinucleotide biosynthesis protein B [Methanoculleus sp.]
MKVIQVIGFSNTGKTTFVGELLERLAAVGTVAAVKHLGGHPYALEEGKDTTLFYEKGAAFSVGIDEEKAVAAIRNPDLEANLRMLCDAGVDYAVVEGFKQHTFASIVIGELESETCVLRNPSVDEVMASLDQFDDFVTLQGLVQDLKHSCDMSRAGALMTFNGIVREWTGETRTPHLDFDQDFEELLASIRREMEQVPGILGVRFHHQKGRLYAGEDITYVAILSERRYEAFSALSNAIDRLKRELHDAGKDIAGV